MTDSLTLNQVTQNSIDIMSLIAILKWPVIVFVMFLIIKKPIIDLINRITKIGHGGTSVEAHQQQAAEKQERKKFSTVDKALGLFRDETIELVKEAVIKETDIKNLGNDKDKVERLTNYSIALYIIKHFESIYNSVFGSQLMILQQLNTFAFEDTNSLKRYYDYAVKQNPKYFEGYSYEDYLDFLFAFNLIVNEDRQIKITILGVDFLKYLTETGKNLNKYN
jgi:hypothetical protein